MLCKSCTVRADCYCCAAKKIVSIITTVTCFESICESDALINNLEVVYVVVANNHILCAAKLFANAEKAVVNRCAVNTLAVCALCIGCKFGCKSAELFAAKVFFPCISVLINGNMHNNRAFNSFAFDSCNTVNSSLIPFNLVIPKMVIAVDD